MTTEYWRNESNMNAMSGSELMMTELETQLGSEFMEPFHITLSRVRELPEDKIRIYWAHDLAEDPEAESALGKGGWKRFHRCVFVSNWQAQKFIERYGIPWSRTHVLRNALHEFDLDVQKKWDIKPDDELRFVYHTTPHRGLALLIPAFEELCKHHENIHLDVFSSFKIYGWDERDQMFQPLYDRIVDHENMTYHGSVSNDALREHLVKSHVFAYPSIWTETSCRALIEAMSAGCACVHPNNGALFETAASWTFMYPYHEDNQTHASMHYQMLNNMIEMIREEPEAVQMKIRGQKSYADVNYSWKVRIAEWRSFLDSLRDLPVELEEPNKEVFSYKVNY